LVQGAEQPCTTDSLLALHLRLGSMLASSSTVANAAFSRRAARPFVPSRSSRVQPVTVAKARLAPLVDELKKDQLRTDLPSVEIGDTVRLGVTVQESKGKTRTQRLEGVVIAMSGRGSNRTVTVRRIFQGVGMELNFHLHSQVCSTVEVVRRAKVRRAKLYYLRERTGKSARLTERFVKQPAAAAAAAP
jgi:large subunit ribosomal protein L19